MIFVLKPTLARAALASAVLASLPAAGSVKRPALREEGLAH
jgi:hypothetical protein